MIMTNTPIKILLVGDYSIFRSALRMVLETDKRIRVVAEVARCELAHDIISEESLDLIVVDLPDFGGKDLLPFFKEVAIPVLILVGKHDVEIYQKCLRFGISGVLPKEENAETLFKAISKIHEGEIWFDRSVMGATIRQLLFERQSFNSHPKAHVTDTLSDRERQVVELICKGMKNKEIGEALFISETTVRHHLSSIFNKLKITSRLELVVYSFKNNLLRSSNGNGNHLETGPVGLETASRAA
jgi:DNA-binding NarL/FixJ family response regulator